MAIVELEPRQASGWDSERQRMLARLHAVELQELGVLQELWEYLRISELMLLDILNGRPANPEHAGKGNARFGHLLYYLHYPHPQLKALTKRDEIAQAAWHLAAHASKPESKMARGCLESQRSITAGWPMVDSAGVIYGFKGYEALDHRWGLALINLVIMHYYKRQDLGSAPCIKELIPGFDGNVRIGVVGDCGVSTFGAGSSAAIELMKQLDAMNCDYLLHMGDAYYTETASPSQPAANEGMRNIIRHWPEHAGRGRSFILNSGLEMYSGGSAYFSHLLGSDLFRHQNMTSYFVLTFGKWVILGLDSAQGASAASLYMNGALGERQSAWIREYRRGIGGFDGKKVLVLTHHEGMNFRGDALVGLYKEVADAIGRAPDVWYSGHLHNGIAYSNASAAGRLGTRARCVGHSATPYGFASGLMDESGRYPVPSVDFFTRTPSPEGGKRVLNGFATLELSEHGDITELFFEQGKTAPVWRSVNGFRFA